MARGRSLAGVVEKRKATPRLSAAPNAFFFSLREGNCLAPMRPGAALRPPDATPQVESIYLFTLWCRERAG